MRINSITQIDTIKFALGKFRISPSWINTASPRIRIEKDSPRIRIEKDNLASLFSFNDHPKRTMYHKGFKSYSRYKTVGIVVENNKIDGVIITDKLRVRKVWIK